MKYRVDSFKDDETPFSGIKGVRATFALELKNKYGLPHSIQEICELWSAHSERSFAGWILDYPEDVEKVFKVNLMPVLDETE